MTRENGSAEDLAAVTECRNASARMRDELSKVIVGRGEVIEEILIAVFARGHVILQGVPGLAKALLLRSLAKAMSLKFKRIPCTPDLTSGDIVGTETFRPDPEAGSRSCQFVPGPLFANYVLADGIDRAGPKTQATILEAMDERQITYLGATHALPDPFFVLATQDPAEQDHRNPLGGAELDRFLLLLKIDYPSGPEEWEIVRRTTGEETGDVVPSLAGDDLLRFQRLIARLPVDDQVLGYAWALVRATRPTSAEAPDFVDRWIARGAGPRGLIALVNAAKARAALDGRCHPTVGDIQAVALPVLRHRVFENFAAQSHNLDSDRLITMIMESIPTDRWYDPPKEWQVRSEWRG